MDQADEELRKTIMKIWPLQSKKMIDLLVPQKEGIYAQNREMMNSLDGIVFIYLYVFQN